MGKFWQLSPDTRLKQSNARKGMKHTDETKRKISQGVKQNYENKGWYKSNVDPETKIMPDLNTNGNNKIYNDNGKKN